MFTHVDMVKIQDDLNDLVTKFGELKKLYVTNFDDKLLYTLVLEDKKQ